MTDFRSTATRSPAWKPHTCLRRFTCSTRSPTHAAAAEPGDVSRCTQLSPGCLISSRIGSSDIRNTELAASPATLRQKALALRGLAQKGDPLAVEIFDFQARALGLHVASLSMALDARFVVIGGGLMDPESTTDAFRERYLRIIGETAAPYLWPTQRATLTIVPPHSVICLRRLAPRWSRCIDVGGSSRFATRKSLVDDPTIVGQPRAHMRLTVDPSEAGAERWIRRREIPTAAASSRGRLCRLPPGAR